MNGNMNLGKRVTALEKEGGADIKKEISNLQDAVAAAQNDINTLETKVNSGHVYSTEEKLFGTWTDGSPVYEKTIIIETPVISENAQYEHGIADFNHLVNANVVYIKSDGTEYAEQIYLSTTNYRAYSVNKTYVNVSIVGDTFATLIVTLQYTKTK